MSDLVDTRALGNGSPTGSILRVEIQEKFYGDEQVLGDIEFSLGVGESMAIVGPSGIGKSTLLRLISGLDTDYEGTISPPDNVSMVFQEPTLFPWISCLQNLTEACADLFPDQMSLGQQRRLALARAFGMSPKLLLLDEAFVSLDPAIYRDMIQLFKSLKSETQVATLMITHDIAEAHELAENVYRLSGAPARLLKT
jgi:NitT/TauT family transport system ATP-binding protein